MKTATIPSLRVAPELREAAEAVLQEGETLSAFVETSIRRCIDSRQAQQAFIARGIVSGLKAKRSEKYVDADMVLGKLEARLAKAKKRA
ncbi:MAG TPA: YlcI/YnfO family protein [Rhodocyclaceae bacterium]|nr:YlcI/YnfO family protein [Rhodocyclaceae bacterium]